MSDSSVSVIVLPSLVYLYFELDIEQDNTILTAYRGFLLDERRFFWKWPSIRSVTIFAVVSFLKMSF